MEKPGKMVASKSRSKWYHILIQNHASCLSQQHSD